MGEKQGLETNSQINLGTTGSLPTIAPQSKVSPEEGVVASPEPQSSAPSSGPTQQFIFTSDPN